jgi:putative ABC transport system substrate-binding protein
MKRCLPALGALIIAMMPTAGMSETYRISVSQIVEHPALNAVLQGFQDDLSENRIEANCSCSHHPEIYGHGQSDRATDHG